MCSHGTENRVITGDIVTGHDNAVGLYDMAYVKDIVVYLL